MAMQLVRHPAFLLAALAFGLTNFASAKDCEPARIDSVITNSPLCPGDHVELSVVALGDIIGYSWQGPGTGETFTFTPEFSFLFPVTGDYTVVVFGECGNDTAMVTITSLGAGAGNGGIMNVCDNGPVKSLDLMLGPHDPGGAWTYFNEPHGNMFDPLVDPPGPYVYTMPDSVACSNANQSATVAVQITRVGPPRAVSICEMDSAVDLAGFLAPDHTENGLWYTMVMLSQVAHPEYYDPAVDSSSTFFYAVAGCTASVAVTEDPASLWFADLDQDGLGDPHQRVLACAGPVDYVSDSTDACGSLAGTIGNHCDDGDSTTVNDHIDADCECVGDLYTSIRVSGAIPALNVWPNPYAEGVLHIAYPGLDSPEIVLSDVHGRTVARQWATSRNGSFVSLELPSGLAPGPYLVRMVSEHSSSTATLLVR